MTDPPYVRKSQPSERLDSGPLVKFLDGWMARHPGESYAHLCDVAGVSRDSVGRSRGFVYLRTADALLVAAGQPPDVLRELYPLDA